MLYQNPEMGPIAPVYVLGFQQEGGVFISFRRIAMS